MGRFFRSVRKAMRIVLVRLKPLTVHTEAVFYDDVWEEVKKRISGGRVLKWYVMTPENYDLSRGYFGLKMSKAKMGEIMKKRYLEMKKMGAKLELHVHLHPTMKIEKSEQEALIGNSLKWFRENLGFKPSEIVFGWWRWNEDSEKIAEKLGLKIVKFDDYNSVHDYDWVIRCKGESYL